MVAPWFRLFPLEAAQRWLGSYSSIWRPTCLISSYFKIPLNMCLSNRFMSFMWQIHCRSLCWKMNAASTQCDKEDKNTGKQFGSTLNTKVSWAPLAVWLPKQWKLGQSSSQGESHVEFAAFPNSFGMIFRYSANLYSGLFSLYKVFWGASGCSVVVVCYRGSEYRDEKGLKHAVTEGEGIRQYRDQLIVGSDLCCITFANDQPLIPRSVPSWMPVPSFRRTG